MKGENLEVIVHDGAGGLNSSVAIVYSRVKVQPAQPGRCVFHKISNLAQNLVNPSNRFAILKDAGEIYEADTLTELRSKLKAFCLKWRAKEPKAVKNFLKGFELTLTYREYPEPLENIDKNHQPFRTLFRETPEKNKTNEKIC